MRLSGYLVVKKAETTRHQHTARFVQKKPSSLAKFEIPIAIEVNIPDELFVKPQLFAKIDVPYSGPSDMSTEVTADIEKTIKRELGLNIKIC